jgi:hypothetical protein
VLEHFQEYNLKLKPKKCLFFQDEITFLGKRVLKGGVKMTPEAIEKIREWPVPTNTKELESFLGFINYYREHICCFLNNERKGCDFDTQMDTRKNPKCTKSLKV